MQLTTLFAIVAVVSSSLSGVLAVRKGNGKREEGCMRTQIAILGAGVAGITAAQTLYNESITDLLIVEYQDRIGGRMHEVNFGTRPDGGQYVVEAGANWVQGLGSPGGPENPIYTLAKKFDLQTILTASDSVATYDKTGAVNYTNVLNALSDAVANVGVYAGASLKENWQDKTFRGGLRLVGWNPEKNDPQAQVAEWFSIDGEFIYTPEESSMIYTSAAENATFQYFSEENRFVYDQRGFSTIIRSEAETFLQPDQVLFNTIVQRVVYDKSGVTVYTDGPCIEADYAIMTFSLGVLQHEIIEFVPELPDWKKSAIASFEMGTYTKIFLQFEQPFWPQNTQFLLWADPHERGYYPQFQPLDLPEVFPGSGILIATVVNKQSYKAEAQTNEETQAELMKVLRQMFGEGISDPTAIYYPRWTQEPWAYGSFSNWPPSTSLAGHQNLRANVRRLYFAGEATSQEFFGYLHGAYFEGRYTGSYIASCIQGTDKCENTDVNGPLYPVLTGVTPYDMYNEENKRFVDTPTPTIMVSW